MNAVTTNLSEPWQLTYDDMPEEEFADGLRISIDCLAARLIAPLDPDRYHEFPEHLGHRGHGFERIVQEWLIAKHGAKVVMREVVVPWEYGETHLDLLIDPETAARVFGCKHDGWLLVELKANKDAQVRSENIRQVQRQQFVVERALAGGKPIRVRHRTTETVATADDGFGTPIVVPKTKWVWEAVPADVMTNLEWRVLVIDPTTWRIPDPRGVKVTISDDRRVELEQEWAQMDTFMALPVSTMKWNIEWPSRMPECTCGKCFRPDVEELDEALAEHAGLYLQAQEEAAFAADQQALAGDYLKSKLAELAPPDKGHTWLGHGYRVTLTKPTAKGTRSLRVKESTDTVAPQL